MAQQVTDGDRHHHWCINHVILVFRWKNVIYGAFFYQLCSRYPDWAKKFVKKLMWKAIDGGMSE